MSILISLFCWSIQIDGWPLPASPGRPAGYLSVTNALLLVNWAINKSFLPIAPTATIRGIG